MASKNQPYTATASPKDSDIRFPAPMIVAASAGSGKTYALALRTTQFLLSPFVPHGTLPSLIAMTFTNAAAEEMRMRVLRFLKEAALGNDVGSENFRNLRAIVTGDKEELRKRAGDLLDQIFARFDEFQVRTIDSFIARAFKASALESGLPPDFELVKDQTPLLEAAFDHYARDAARRTNGLNDLVALVDLLDFTARPSSFDWNPFNRIVSGSASMLLRIASRPAEFDIRDTSAALHGALEQLRATAGELKGLLVKVPSARAKVMEDLEHVLSDDWRKALRAYPEYEALTKGAKGGPIDQSTKERISRLFSRFNGERQTLALMEAVSYYSPFVKALSVVSDAIQSVKRTKGMYSIDDVNRLLWKSVSAGSAPTIFVTLGTRLYHYLIDEFQDTSPIQWAALKILIENACAEDGSLYAVGDTKQSIYSFRGADWQIMHRLLEGKEQINFQECLTASLDTNYRSDEAIIRFVEEVFTMAGEDPDYAAVTRLTGLDRCAQKTIGEKAGKGHVEVQRVPKNDSGQQEAMVVGLVQDALRRGHPAGSIAILAETNDRVLEVGGWLNRTGITFLSHSNLDVRKRPVIMEVISLLTWLDAPTDDLSFAGFIMGETFSRFLRDRGARSSGSSIPDMRQHIMDHRRMDAGPLYTIFRAGFPDLWESCFAGMLAHVGYLPAYDVVCEVFKTFDLFSLVPEEQAALSGMLDAVKNLEAEGATSLKGVLSMAASDEGDLSDEMWNLATQKKTDAVTVMTIHKAKGLQFPVLIVLLSEGRGMSDPMKLDERDGMLRFYHVTQSNAERHPQLQEIYDHSLVLYKADALNRLYVALTRAQHELYVVLAEGEKRKFPSTIIPDAGDATARPMAVMEPGERTDVPALLPLTHALAASEEQGQKERIGFLETQRGDFLHRVLSRVGFISGDIGMTVHSALAGEQEAVKEFPAAEATLTAFLQSADAKPLFAPRGEFTVMNEREFLNRVGQLQRMDRVIVGPDAVEVIDYKTGGEEYQASHKEQVFRYLEILAEIYPGKTLRGFIAYVDRRKVVSIPSPRYTRGSQ